MGAALKTTASSPSLRGDKTSRAAGGEAALAPLLRERHPLAAIRAGTAATTTPPAPPTPYLSPTSPSHSPTLSRWQKVECTPSRETLVECTLEGEAMEVRRGGVGGGGVGNCFPLGLTVLTVHLTYAHIINYLN